MLTAAPQAGPRLGDSFQVFSAHFGAPRQTTTTQGWVVRRYTSTCGTVTVLFEHGRSVALRLRYPMQHPCCAAAVHQAAQFAPECSQHPRVHLDNRGWILAADTCPPAALQLLREEL
jgi:hypothetical protein